MADDNDAKKVVRKVAVTNNDVGPRFVNTARGQEVVLVGQTLNTEMNGFQIDSLDTEYVHDTEDAPRWTVEGVDGDLEPAGDEGKALVGLPVAKLRQIAAAEGVTLTNRGKDKDGVADLPDLKSAVDIATAIQAHRDANPA